MIFKENKRFVMNQFNQGIFDDLILGNEALGDHIILTLLKNNYLSNLGSYFLDHRRNNKSIPLDIYLILGAVSKLKQHNALSSMPYAIEDTELLEKLGWNLFLDIDDNETGIVSEGSIRHLISSFEIKDLIKGYNDYLAKEVIPKLDVRPSIHILDCTIIEAKGDKNKYDEIGTVKKNNQIYHGYKLSTLRGVLPDGGGIIEAISIGLINEHDFSLSKDILNSDIFESGDIIIEDAGFVDRKTINHLKSKGVDTYIRVKKNMEIHKEAVALACLCKKEWKKHPNKKRDKQKIKTVEEMGRTWIHSQDDVDLNVAVVWNTKKNDYYVFATTDLTKKAKNILKTYELRPEIEEDYRQKKVYWGLQDFTSKKYKTIAFHIVSTLIGYLFYQLFTTTKEGSKYFGKTIETAYFNFNREKIKRKERNKKKNQKVILYIQEYFAVIKFIDLMNAYADLPKIKRKKVEKLINNLYE